MDDLSEAIADTDEDEYPDDQYDDYYAHPAPRPELSEEEKAERERRRLRLDAAFPSGGSRRQWEGQTARVRPDRKAIVHRLRCPEVDDWDLATEGAMTLCGHLVVADQVGNDVPDCRNCEGWLKGSDDIVVRAALVRSETVQPISQ